MNEIIEFSDYIFRLATAFLLGAAIGFERQWHQKSAGLRTNTLVAIGAASFVLLSVILHGKSGGDPGRIIAQIVTGIGFIGAGVIMKDGFDIRGLNTAATIWCSAAVGTFAGMGLFIEASLTTVTIITAHLALRPVSIRLARLTSYEKNKIRQTRYRVKIQCLSKYESSVRQSLLDYLVGNDQLLMRSISRDYENNDADDVTLILEVSTIGRQENVMEVFLSHITNKHDVKNASWEIVSHEKEY